MKPITFAVIAAALTMSAAAHAAPDNLGVDCDAIAAAEFSAFAAHHEMKGSVYTEGSMTRSLHAYCEVGVGFFLQGTPLNTALDNAAAGMTGSPDATAALLSATASGYLYKSAHEMKTQKETAK